MCDSAPRTSDRTVHSTFQGGLFLPMRAVVSATGLNALPKTHCPLPLTLRTVFTLRNHRWSSSLSGVTREACKRSVSSKGHLHAWRFIASCSYCTYKRRTPQWRGRCRVLHVCSLVSVAIKYNSMPARECFSLPLFSCRNLMVNHFNFLFV